MSTQTSPLQIIHTTEIIIKQWISLWEKKIYSFHRRNIYIFFHKSTNKNSGKQKIKKMQMGKKNSKSKENIKLELGL